ncbi:multiprotein-bridging factor 1 family protein [Streptomyces collinus]|uniref:Transcriptional regulator n=1 Tax=Streptomyces collinus TaxID=42684 RepID=A0AA89PWH1_STRCU|nr:helix-turn-helix transcriptional regulator [Streptomyces collinus]MBB5809748.1 putative transcriptional regulator [Streptomyces collinus]WMX63064.1 helix-turn-helix transcriptional regulator [Streptomyces collinus]
MYYVADGDWPEVTLTHDAPLSAHCGLPFASDLNRTMRSRKLSLRGLADVACVAHSTVARVLNGDVLPDIGTLTRLEDALDHQRWPDPTAIRASVSARRQVI